MTKRIFLLAIIFVLFLSCSSENSNNSENLTSFNEPPLNFLISQEQFITENGQPNSTIGATLFYTSNQNGEIDRTFDFDRNNQIDSYFLNNVSFNSNQNNLDFMLKWLTNKYGEPILEIDYQSSPYYIWYNNNTSYNYIVNLVFSTDLQSEDAILIVAYIHEPQ
ncbi:hypothetical protein M8845_18915 [Gelidibacter japonicus]|uniref:hypothetical protein n=1 Tax=Gelidibacter japonicus TaxID=1962232 RepID=UPI00202299DE|nr:hypothetical protein [Gelidibacter japonicus]MCL8009500.1 hypothetical protein [Gelidibacter japonicus]